MIPYFSGVKSHTELQMLQSAGVDRILVDRVDFPKISPHWKGNIALDSGAYRLKDKVDMTAISPATIDHLIRCYLELANSRPCDFVTTLDVFGNAALTRQLWDKIRAHPDAQTLNLIPVWVWGSDRTDLHRYLDESDIVGIGGLVPPMRDRSEDVLDALVTLCTELPGRFHLFGLCWFKAINLLRGVAYSFDSSNWLDAARYNQLVFIHTKNNCLQAAPAAVMKMAHLSREERCIVAARVIQEFCLGET